MDPLGTEETVNSTRCPKGKIDEQSARMMLNIYYQEKQAWRGRRLRAVTLIKSHEPCSVPYLSQFSDPELIGAEVAGSLGGNTL